MTELLASPARIYAALIENSGDCIGVVAADGRTVFQSPGITRQLGYQPAELIGRENFDLLHPDDQAAARERFAAVLAGEAPASPIRVRARHKDGSWRILECTTSRFVDEPGQSFLVLNARDVTAITEATAALRASEHRLDLALELGEMGVSEFTYRTGEILFATSFTRLLGYDPAPPNVGFEWFLEHVHADDRASVAATIELAIDAPAEDQFEVLFRVIRRDGATRWWVGRARVMRDEHGQPTHAIGLVNDVTERRHLEEQVRQAQKLDAIGRLAGGVAHDFNNLLTVITGYADTLLRSMSSADPRFGDLLEIRRAADRAALLTQQLLAFSRKQILHPEIVDSSVVVRDIATMVARLIGDAIELKVDVEDRPATVLADRGQLEQVLINLAVNARDAMPDGGLLEMRTRIAAVSEDEASRLYPIRPGTYVRLSVTDTGIGMPPEVQARVFEPFFTTKEPGKGTGIGLSTVYGIVKQSGGFVFLTSETGQGTTFDVYLPLAAVKARPRRAGTPRENTKDDEGTPFSTALLVEDDRRVRDLSRRVLTRQGYHVLSAQSGREALELARVHDGDIDVLVTDVMMPGMSGPELARHLQDTRPGTAVVYLSGYAGDVLDRQGGGDPGAAIVLDKPFTPIALVRTVKRALSTTRERRRS